MRPWYCLDLRGSCVEGSWVKGGGTVYFLKFIKRSIVGLYLKKGRFHALILYYALTNLNIR